MKRLTKIVSSMLLLSCLSGCSFATGDDLLQAPKPTKNYLALQNELEAMLKTGAVYASPESGENRNTVQLKDLDGDGEEEAIALFRESSGSTKFIIFVYKKIGETYIKMGTINGSGTAIASIDYPVLSPDGRRGIVIAWQLVGDGTTGMTVSALSGAKIVNLLETEYNSFQLTDLDADGAEELVTVTIDPQGRKSAKMYDYTEGEMEVAGEAALSIDANSIVRVQSGYALGKQPAIFVEEKNESGVGLLTDIFIYQDGIFRNCAMETEQEQRQSTYRPVSIYVTDINGDDMIDVPRAVLSPGYAPNSKDPQYYLDWYTYGYSAPQYVRTTYNSQLEEWKFTIPDAWRTQVSVRRTNRAIGVSCTTFLQIRTDGTEVPLLHLYYLTGEAREYYAQTTGMIRLQETPSAIYAAEIPEEAAESTLYLESEQVKEHFALITQEWS